MIYHFPSGKKAKDTEDTIHVRLNLTFDVPEEIAEQFERIGLEGFETCTYDQDTRRLEASMATTFYRNGA